MANPVFDRSKAIRAILDAVRMGDDKAAERHGIDTRTLRRYRARLDSDPELSAELSKLGQAEERHWKATANRTMSVLHAQMQKLIPLATVDELAVLAKLHESISNSDIALKALVGDSSHPEGAAAEEAASDDEGSAPHDVAGPRASAH